MPIFLLVRHGENEYVQKGRLAGRLPGVHLNANGRRQAQATAETLRQAPVTAIYSSPLERAVETAEPISQALGLPVSLHPGLMETDCGSWQGKTLKRLGRLKVWRTVQNTPSLFQFPGGESFIDTQHRICAALQDLCSRHDPKDLLVCVSHADPIKLAVAFYLGLPLDHFQRLAVTPASITALMIDEHHSQLLLLNYNPSLTIPKL